MTHPTAEVTASRMLDGADVTVGDCLQYASARGRVVNIRPHPGHRCDPDHTWRVAETVGGEEMTLVPGIRYHVRGRLS